MPLGDTAAVEVSLGDANMNPDAVPDTAVDEAIPEDAAAVVDEAILGGAAEDGFATANTILI